MKKLFILCLALFMFSSCSEDDKLREFYFEIVPIETVTIPETVVSGQTINIGYTYLRSSTCHLFNDLYFTREGNERTIAVVNTVFENAGNGAPCQELNEEIITRFFEFQVTNFPGSIYTFRFWQGKDENNEDIYLIIDVPVVE